MTSTVLVDLKAVAYKLEDEKVTVRKSHDDTLRSMLANNRIVAMLNESTIRGGSGYSWTDLYRSVFRYLDMEVKRAEKEVVKVGASLPKKKLQLIDKVKQGPVSLLQLILKKGNQNQPFIRCESLVDNMIEILSLESARSPFFRTYFGDLAVHVITDRVLAVKKYRSEIRVPEDCCGNQWKSLLKISFDLFMNIPEYLDFHSCCKFLRGVAIYGCEFTDLRNSLRSNVDILEQILKSPKLSQASMDTKNIFFEALNRIVLELSHDYRQLMCKLGEAVTPTILHQCAEDRNINSQIIRFVIIQIKIHHPNGSSDCDQGALIHDELEWKNILQQIYLKLVVGNAKNLIKASRTKFVKTPRLREDIVELGALVGRQVLLSKDKNQSSAHLSAALSGQWSSSDDSQESFDNPPAKRPRIERETNDSILQELTFSEHIEKGEESLLPWLQIVERILLKYPKVAGQSMNLPFTILIFERIVTLLQIVQILEVKELLLRCAHLIIGVSESLEESKDQLQRIVGKEFTKLWETALSIVSLNQCTGEGHKLLRSMLLNANQEQVGKLYRLFINDVIKFNKDAVETLLWLLIVAPKVPEVTPRTLATSQNFASDHLAADSGRKELLEWLWPSKNPTTLEVWSSFRKSHSELLASAVACFTLRIETVESRMLFAENIAEKIREKNEFMDKDLENFISQTNELESLYQTSSHFIHQGSESGNKSRSLNHECLSIINSVKAAIHDKLMQVSCSVVTTLNEKYPRREDEVTALESIRFYLHFLKNFHDWGISLSDEKSMKEMKRMLDVHKSTVEKICINFQRLVRAEIDTSQCSTFVMLSSGWISFLSDLRQCSRHVGRVEEIIACGAVEELYGFVHDSVLSKYVKGIMDLFNKPVTVKNTQTQPTNLTVNDDVDFFDEENGKADLDIIDGHDDVFNDHDENKSDINHLEAVIHNSFVLIAHLFMSSEKLREENIGVVFKRLIQYIQELARIRKHNGVIDHYLMRFIKDTVRLCIEQVMSASRGQLKLEEIFECLKLVQTLAKLYLAKQVFQPQICKIMIRSMGLILNHINKIDEEDSDEMDLDCSDDLTMARNSFVMLCVGLIRTQSMASFQRYSLEIETELVDLVGKVSLADPLGKWAKTDGEIFNSASHDDSGEFAKDSQSIVSMSAMLSRFVVHPNHKIRLRAADHLLQFFLWNSVEADHQQVSAAKRDKLFQVYESIAALCNDNLPLAMQKFSSDEKRNRFATFLFVLSSVAMKYSPLEYDCVARILSPFQLAKIPSETLKRVFTRLAHGKNCNGNVNEYLEPMLPYVLKEFMKQNKPWTEFPYDLLDCESVSSFAKKHEKSILPVLLWNGKSETRGASENEFVKYQLIEFSKLVGKDVKSLIVDNFSEIVPYFLPTVIANDENSELANQLCNKKKLTRAVQIHESLESELNLEKYFQLLSELMPEILARILSHIQDPESLMKHLETQKLETSLVEKLLPFKQSVNPPTIPVPLVTNLMGYFGRVIAEGKPLFGHLVSNSSDCLIRLFLNLCASLKLESSRASSKLRALQGLYLLGSQLTAEILTHQSVTLTSQLPYLSWYLTHTLMNFVTSTMRNHFRRSSMSWQESALCILMAIDTLAVFLKVFRVMKEVHVKRNVILATNSLIEIISDVDEISESSNSGLWMQTAVLIKNVAASTLSSMITATSNQFDLRRSLDPFPKSATFTFKKIADKIGIDWKHNPSLDSLANVIKAFIDKGNIEFCGMNKSLHRKEGLQRLLLKLKSCHSDLKEILQELALSQGMSEDASRSYLHMLVSQLIDLSNSDHIEVSELATKCLEEIGPVNFGTLILNPANSLESIPIHVVKLVLNYIVSNEQITSSVAVIALKHIFCTNEGRETLGEQTKELEFAELSHPFNGPLCSATLDYEAISSEFKPFDIKTFTEVINDESLWSPEVVSNPGSWICNLVFKLLSELPSFKKSQFKTSPVLGRHLKKLAFIQPEFSTKIFPFLIYHILTTTLKDNPQIGCILSKQINRFFEKHFQSYSVRQHQKGSFLDLTIVRTMLSACSYLRMFNKPQVSEQSDQKRALKSPTWENNFWIMDINYLHLAKAAFFCSDFFTAVQFADIWCLRLLELHPDLSSKFAVSFQQTNLLNFLHENLTEQRLIEDVKTCQRLLAETYQNLGNVDAIYGCGEERLLNVNARIQHLVNENQLYKALGMYDQLASQSDNVDHEEGLVSTLLSSGFYHTMNRYILGLKRRQTVQSSILEYQNECALRLGQWSSAGEDDSHTSQPGLSFSRHKIFALDNLLGDNENPPEFVRHITSARKLVAAEIHRLSFGESACTTVTTPLAKLRSLRELEIIADLMPRLGKRISDIDSGIHERVHASLAELQSYEEVLLSSNISSDFENSEVILSQRCVALSLMANKQRLDNVNESPVKRKQLDLLKIRRETSSAYISNALKLNQVARENGRFQIALNCLNGVKNLLGKIEYGGKYANLLDDATCKQLEMQVQYEESLLMWDWKERDLASKQLKQLVKTLQKQESPLCHELLPEALGTLGSWMSELRSEHASTIVDEYLRKSVTIFEKIYAQNLHQEKIVEAYLNLARFSDDQYTRLSEYMSSKDFEDTQHLTAQIREESKSIKDIGGTARDAKYATLILDRNSDLDRNEIDRMTDEKLRYLLSALENYCKALSFGEKHDLKAYRLISLWFSNLFEEVVNQYLNKWLDPIPSHKFVGLLYQLCARMVTQSTPGIHAASFPNLLLKTISRCAFSHPYHALPIILALSNSNADEAEVDEAPQKQPSRGTSVNSSNGRSSANKVQEERTMAAKKVLHAMRKRQETFVSANEKLALSLIKLAYQKDAKITSGRVSIDRAHPLRKLKNLAGVAVPTLNIPVNPEGKYPEERIVSFVEIAPEYQMVGGINAPKKIKCLGSDGKWRPQLVKGRDDLRQDAVMQQVFGLMNTLLTKDSNTKKRRLNVRQYKVVPLSQRSGILEWCENTVVMKDFLIGEDSNSGAHRRYHPEDFQALKCRKELGEIQKSKKRAEILKVFLHICQNIKPSMKYFFFENFPSPGVYLERRLAYSRSSATSSMVGYILGLGDRHVQNILLDSRTAEMIHIDLGIAFDQGKILPTPETIPFRLTRDVIDGFGPSGVEGTFQRCCEATMRVLRGHKDEIMTILEVLVHDPLYNWSLTPSKAYKLQTGREPDDALKAKWDEEARKKRDLEGKNDKSGNSMAERVLLKVSQKLNGTADGSYLSVEGHVNSLIQQARDPERLCTLFVGWQPYL